MEGSTSKIDTLSLPAQPIFSDARGDAGSRFFGEVSFQKPIISARKKKRRRSERANPMDARTVLEEGGGGGRKLILE